MLSAALGRYLTSMLIMRKSKVRGAERSGAERKRLPAYRTAPQHRIFFDRLRKGTLLSNSVPDSKKFFAICSVSYIYQCFYGFWERFAITRLFVCFLIISE